MRRDQRLIKPYSRRSGKRRPTWYKTRASEDATIFLRRVRTWEELADRGDELAERFKRNGDEAVREEAIQCFASAAKLCPNGVADATYILGTLANMFFERFEVKGDLADLGAAIIHYEGMLKATPPSDPDRSTIINNTASALLTRFRHVGNRADLDVSIAYYQAALELRPQGHPYRCTTLLNLANSFQIRFENLGDRVDLDAAIAYQQAALELTPPGHPDRSASFSILACALLTRFQQLGDRIDLDTAISYDQVALELRPPGHPERSMSLNNLAGDLNARFDQLGDRRDLDAAISYYQAALELRPPGHPDRSMSLGNLATAFTTRFQQVGDRADLDAAIIHHQAALELRSPGHPDRSGTLACLAHAIGIRFHEAGDRADLDAAIAYNQASLELRPPGHLHRFMSLNNLASTLQNRFEYVGDRADLDAAITHFQATLELTPPGHFGYSSSLNNLSKVLETRFRQLGNRADLDTAISHSQAALELRPPGHPNRCGTLRNLAVALASHFEAFDIPITPDQSASLPHVPVIQGQIFAMLDEATSSTTGGPPTERFRASLVWVDLAVKWSHSKAIEAYRTSLALLETILANSSSLEARHLHFTSFLARHTQNLAVDGAACAIAAGQIEIALELLEQGRTMLLTQAGKYRTRVDDLEMMQPALAAEFRAISTKMEASAMNDGHLDTDRNSNIMAEDGVAKYQKLSQIWNDVVARIRCLGGFESFLEPTPFTILQKAADEGPVVVINLSEKRSDAIIIQHDEAPHLVPLPDVTLDAVLQLAQKSHDKTSDREFKAVLYDLWCLIVEPVVKVLKEDLQLPRGSRFWWCPTGAAAHLPLHAAGDYNKKGQSLPDLFIPSYTPTLAALVRSRLNTSARPAVPNILVVSQAQTLPQVRSEIKMIQGTSNNLALLDGSDATRDRVMDAIARHSWIHLACHGHVDEKRPFRSNFTLYDGPLTLLDIASQNIPNAQLAFLSACHSAEGSRDRPDEVLHLTAGIQFAGFRSVVGTLWAVNDEDGPVVAEIFYSNLLGSEGVAPVSSALALHRAVAKLRRHRNMSSSRWACFVHYGC